MSDERVISFRKWFKEYEFSSDKLLINGSKYAYGRITGYSYQLSSYRLTLYYLLPVFNSVKYSYKFQLDTGELLVLDKVVILPMFFHSKKQRQIPLFFAELTQHIDSNLKRFVLKNLIDSLQKRNSIIIGDIAELNSRELVVKRKRNSVILLSEISQVVISEGQVNVYDKEGRIFSRFSISQLNAPLLPDLVRIICKHSNPAGQ